MGEERRAFGGGTGQRLGEAIVGQPARCRLSEQRKALRSCSAHFWMFNANEMQVLPAQRGPD